MQRPAVSVVVLGSEDRPESIETCLQALHPMLWVHDEVLMVVPDSTTRVGPDVLFPWARRVDVPPGASAAAAADIAVEQARHPYVVLLNSDVVVTPDWLTRLMVPMRDFTVGAVAPRSNVSVHREKAAPDDYDPARVDELFLYSLEWHWEHVGQRSEQSVLDAFCLALRVDAWRSVGGFDPAQDRPGHDVSAFCARLRDQDWSLVSADDTFVHRALPGTAFADGNASQDFRWAHDQRQLRRTQELGGAVAFDRKVLRSHFAGDPAPSPTPLVADASALADGPRPRITVVVPTFNRPQLLGRALESIADQTAHAEGIGVEVIVVNDGGLDVRAATDEFASVLDLRVLRNDVNRGRAAACNRGLVAARGELVAFLDDDDIYFPHHLATVLRAWEQDPSPRTIAFSYAINTTLSEARGALLRGVFGDQPLNGEILAVRNTIAGLTVLAPTNLLREEGGFDERLAMFDDWELWLRLVRGGVRVKQVYTPTAEMFRHERRVGHKEIRRTHTALMGLYRQHPVAAGSVPDDGRLKWVTESLSGAESYPLDVSVVVSAEDSALALVRTLKSAAVAMTGGRWELIILAPDIRRFSSIFDQLEGDLRGYSVGDLTAEQALEFGAKRAGGRHVLMLEAGEVLDTVALLEVLGSPEGNEHRIGIREEALSV